MARRFGDWVIGGGPDPYERYCVAAVVAFLTCVVAVLIATGFQQLEYGRATPTATALSTSAFSGVICGGTSGVAVFSASYFLTGSRPLNRWVVGVFAGVTVGIVCQSWISIAINDGSLRDDVLLGQDLMISSMTSRERAFKAAVGGTMGGVITGSIAAAHLIVMGRRTPQAPATNAA